MTKSTLLLIALAVLIVGSLAGYWYGSNRGYSEAEDDIQKLQQEATEAAVEEAARVANPFRTKNPLEGIDTDPFQKTKEVLNPFK